MTPVDLTKVRWHRWRADCPECIDGVCGVDFDNGDDE